MHQNTTQTSKGNFKVKETPSGQSDACVATKIEAFERLFLPSAEVCTFLVYYSHENAEGFSVGFAVCAGSFFVFLWFYFDRTAEARTGLQRTHNLGMGDVRSTN